MGPQGRWSEGWSSEGQWAGSIQSGFALCQAPFWVFSSHVLPKALGSLFVVGEYGEEVGNNDLSGTLVLKEGGRSWSGESSPSRTEAREQGWARQRWTY